jgi:hypothetical protein
MDRQDLATEGGAAAPALPIGYTRPPGIGTPGAWNHGGNSAPAQAPVAGLGKSEQSGERRGSK